jgi:hypothetical protein
MDCVGSREAGLGFDEPESFVREGREGEEGSLPVSDVSGALVALDGTSVVACQLLCDWNEMKVH